MMKNVSLLVLTLLSLFLSASAQTEIADPNAPVFKWEEETHNFGKIPQGIPATVKFTFTNTGKSNLKIETVKPTCGCTIANWTREEIKPGESGFVEATYNAAAAGQFNKGITVVSNAVTPVKMLYLTGEVISQTQTEQNNNNPAQH